MASTCFQSIADRYPYKSILNLDFQLPKPPAPSDARFNLSPVNTPCLMHDRQFQGLPATGQSLSSGCTADPEEEAEMSNSDDDDLPSVRKIIARSRSTIDLTLDDDDDDDSASDKNTIETTSNLPTYSPHVPPSLSQKSSTHTADDHTTSSAAATPARKIFPWKNVPPWSPLYHKLQLHSTTSLHNL